MCSTCDNSQVPWRFWCVCVGAATALLAGIICVVAPDPSTRLTAFLSQPEPISGQGYPLTISPDPITLGVLAKPTLLQGTFSVENTGNAPLILERIETSCPCIRIAPVPFQIKAKERKLCTVTFDPSSEPDFRGKLSVEVSG